MRNSQPVLDAKTITSMYFDGTSGAFPKSPVLKVIPQKSAMAKTQNRNSTENNSGTQTKNKLHNDEGETLATQPSRNMTKNQTLSGSQCTSAGDLPTKTKSLTFK